VPPPEPPEFQNPLRPRAEQSPPVPIPVIPLETVGADVPASPGRRFCTTCGAPWQPTWATCPACDARHRHAPPPPSAALTGRPVASALGLYFTFLGLLIAAMVVIIASGDSPATATRVEIGVGVLIAAAVLAWCAAQPREILPLLARTGQPKWWALAVAAVPVTFGLATLTVNFLVRVVDLPQLHYVQPIVDAGFGWRTVLLLICVQPAVCEELAFRGVILGGMRHVLPDREAIIVSALLFMIIHLSLLSFPHLVLIGLVLGYVRVKSGSLYPCMLAHFLHNLAVVLSEASMS
jgi:membrane protease YdiL (CAAX protease family)